MVVGSSVGMLFSSNNALCSECCCKFNNGLKVEVLANLGVREKEVFDIFDDEWSFSWHVLWGK